MAFAITNRLFVNPEASYIPAVPSTIATAGPHVELPDQTLVTAGTLTTPVINTGVVGCKWVRVRVYVKALTGLAATNIFEVALITGATSSPTENTAGASRRMQTGDTVMYFDFSGATQNALGFQFWKMILTGLTTAGAATTATCVADVMVDVL